MGSYLKELIELRKNFVNAYEKMKYAEALDCGNKIIDIYKKNNETDTAEYAEDINNIAILYDDMHIPEKAKGYYLEAAEIKKKVLGEDSESYYDTLTNLGTLYSITGEYKNAENILKDIRDHAKEKHGINSVPYIEAVYNLGNMYVDNDKSDMGITFLAESLECAKRTKECDANMFTDIHVSIAEAAENTGNYRRAADEYERAVKAGERAGEKDTYFKMTYLMNYANVCQSLDKFSEAADIYIKALNIREKIMDINHLDYISMLNGLAAIYTKDCKYEKALEVHNRILGMIENMLGKNHIFYGDVLTNIGLDYSRMGDFDKAVEYHNRALNIKKEAVGEKSLHYTATLLALSEVYENIGKYDRAIEIQDKVLELKRDMFGEVNEQIPEILINLGRINMEKGELLKAQGFIMQGLIMSKELMLITPGKIRSYTENVRIMAEACCKKKDVDKTIQFCNRYLELRKSKYGDEHPKYARALHFCAELYEQLGENEKASECLDTACYIAEMMMGNDTVFCRQCYYHSGALLYKVKKYNEAAERLRKAASMYKRYNGSEEDLIKIMYLQAKTQYMLGFPRKADECAFRAEGAASRAGCNTDFIINEQIAYAELMLNGGDYDKAAEKLSAVEQKVKENGENAIIYEVMSIYAEACYNAQKYEDAALKAENALEYAKTGIEKADMLLLMAEAQLKLEKYDKSVELLEKIKSLIEADSNVLEKYKSIVYCMLGEVYGNLNETEKADKHFDEGIKEAKSRENIDVENYCMFLDMAASVAEKIGKYSKAVEYISENALMIRKSEGESIRFAEYILNSARLYCIQNRYEESILLYEKALEIYSKVYGEKSDKYINAFTDMCKALAALGKNGEVIEKIEKLDSYGNHKKELTGMLAEAYKNTKAYKKLVMLKFKEK